MPELWVAFIEDYKDHLHKWPLELTLEAFWHYCQAGNMIELCSLCGCPNGQTCQADGSCSSTILVTQQQQDIKPLSILERIALFFKSLFGR